jgi:hypothetical protein
LTEYLARGREKICKLIGQDGIGRVSKVLRKEVSEEKAKEFREKAMACHSYDEVLSLCSEYVEIE